MRATDRANLAAFAGLLVLLFLERLALALAALPALAHAVQLLVLALAFGLALSLGRRLRRADGAPWLRRAAPVAVVALALALVAQVTGRSTLAALLGRGILASALAGLYTYAAVISLQALLTSAPELSVVTTLRSEAKRKSASETESIVSTVRSL